MHMSPIGPHVNPELSSWILKPFQSSKTFANLQATSRAIFHIVDDPLLMAAAVIGGISLQGGRGTMLGALGGVLLLSVIDRGLNLMHLSVFWVKVTQGLIILLAMFIDAQRVRIRTLAQTTTVRESKDNAIGS